MHGLINRSIQRFLRDTHGVEFWEGVADASGVEGRNFEAMMRYPDAITYDVLDTAALRLRRPRESLLEDLGTYLVSHPGFEALRRLLRFGGVGFTDFLHSLDELQGRGWMAVPDLDLPELNLVEHTPQRFTLACRSPHAGFGHVMMGILRAMADDYGALVILDFVDGDALARESLAIELVESAFSEGRRFDLAAGAC